MPRPWLRIAAIAFGFLVLGVLPLHGQRTRAKPDSLLLARYHETLILLRDTLTGVTAATFEFGRDLRAAGGETVLARARRLRVQCHAAGLVMHDAEPAFQPWRVPATARQQAGALGAALRRLRAILREQCELGFRQDGPGSWSDSLRAWGPYRSSQIDTGVREYEAMAARFAAAVGVRLEPNLPGPGPGGRREEGKGKREE